MELKVTPDFSDHDAFEQGCPKPFDEGPNLPLRHVLDWSSCRMGLDAPESNYDRVELMHNLSPEMHSPIVCPLTSCHTALTHQANEPVCLFVLVATRCKIRLLFMKINGVCVALGTISLLLSIAGNQEGTGGRRG